MQWGSLENFLSMGGYGFYVWGSYVVAVVVIGAEIWALRSRRRAALGEVRRTQPAAGRSA
ncbi:MAG: heme exporter protein CcmD [Burkholderiales bacterium]|nr:MAG: heme exporter protein CcmD [Burkholderiales bacterium]